MMAVPPADGTLTGEAPPLVFRTAHSRAIWAIGFLVISIAVTILTLTVVSDYFYLRVGSESGDGLVLGGSILQLIAGAGCVITFLRWFSRAYRQLPALGAQELQFTSRSAVGWWFVPIAFLWVPLRIAIELWKGSDPSPAANDGVSRRAVSTPILLGVWWGTWLLALFLDNFWAAPQRVALQGQDLTLAIAASGFMDIAAAGMAIAVIAQIDLRQTSRRARQTEGQ
jgi:hypothetical protein